MTQAAQWLIDSIKAATAATIRRLPPAAGAAASLFFAAIVLLAILPHVAVLVTSLTATGTWYKQILPSDFTLNHYHQALVDELAFPSIQNSLLYALQQRKLKRGIAALCLGGGNGVALAVEMLH
jgi:ABC-type glycerol-3-phosphate transport system permease component